MYTNKWYIVITDKHNGKEYYVCKKYKGSYVTSIQKECRLETSQSHATRIGRYYLNKGLSNKYETKRIKEGEQNG